MPIRHATASDLPEIVSIYNASIPGRMATADLAPVSVAERKQWFADFDAAAPAALGFLRRRRSDAARMAVAALVLRACRL